MKAVIQRVTNASVTVENEIVGEINNGFLVLLGVKIGDTKEEAEILAKKIYGLRIFSDSNDKMNLSLADINGEILVVSQFTLLADCSQGRRPYFKYAEKPDRANELYEYFCEVMRTLGVKKVEKGIFGADMKVSLTNDGPVTILLDNEELKK